MDFGLNNEQSLLKSSVDRFLGDHHGFERRRQRLAAGLCHDPELWRSLACDLGLAAVSVPAEAGGLGGGAVETMIIMEALGANLVIEPFLETVVLGGTILGRSGGPRADTLLRAVIAGEALVAVALFESNAGLKLENVALRAKRAEGGGWILEGKKPVVWSAPSATHILVSARTSGPEGSPEGISLFLVEADRPGLDKHGFRLIDDRGGSDLYFNSVQLPADALLGAEGAALPLIEETVDRGIAALCADAVGGMRRMLEMTIAYTKDRRQFGQALASFQVLQHRMVDMHMAVELSVSAVYLATLNLDGAPAQRARSVSAAKYTVSRNARMVGQAAVQLHGAMGMTDELSVGHFFKRATLLEQAFGTASHHLARYGEALAA